MLIVEVLRRSQSGWKLIARANIAASNRDREKYGMQKWRIQTACGAGTPEIITFLTNIKKYKVILYSTG